jgi:hypothetical protein
LKNIKANHWCKRNVVGIFVFAVMLLSFGGNCFAAEYVELKMYPEHVGVFTVDGQQQFIAFGIKSNGNRENITSQVSWESSDENIVTIDQDGLATIVGSVTSGQVKISCLYPKKGGLGTAVNFLLL